jgi:hypothetical protein
VSPSPTLADGKSRAPKDEETLTQAGLENGGSLYLKDLGPQVSWTTVFVIEYVRVNSFLSWIYHLNSLMILITRRLALSLSIFSSTIISPGTCRS